MLKIKKILSILLSGALLLAYPAAASAATTGTAGGAETSAPVVTQTQVTEKGTPLESLNVSYWPEYDDPSVLVMYRGVVDASVKVPATVKIAIPKGSDVRVVATSAVDTNGQFQYDKAWNSKQEIDAGDKTILTYKTIYPEFQFEIYMQRVSGGGKRNFDFSLPSISEIKNLSVDIKKPTRADNFKATPVAAQTKLDGQFENHLYSFSDVKPGQQYAFNVTYERSDSKPSVDKQTGVVDTSGGSSQTALILIGILALVGVAIGAGVWRMKAAPVTPARGRPVKDKVAAKTKSGSKSNKSAKANQGKGKKSASGSQSPERNFCAGCGEKINPGDKFCPGCGNPTSQTQA